MPKAPTQAKTAVKKSTVKKTAAVSRATATERVFINGYPNKLYASWPRARNCRFSLTRPALSLLGVLIIIE